MDVMTPVYAVQSLITLISLVIAIFFILNQYRTLHLIRPRKQAHAAGAGMAAVNPHFQFGMAIFCDKQDIHFHTE
jgi:hypothetical protein